MSAKKRPGLPRRLFKRDSPAHARQRHGRAPLLPPGMSPERFLAGLAELIGAGYVLRIEPEWTEDAMGGIILLRSPEGPWLSPWWDPEWIARQEAQWRIRDHRLADHIADLIRRGILPPRSDGQGGPGP